MKRLWISSMEDSAIREGFANLRPGSDYDGLHPVSYTHLLAIVMTLELIQMITDRNNLHDVDTWMIFKWVFKSAAAIPEYPRHGKTGIQPTKVPQTAPKQDGVQRLVDIEQKMAEDLAPSMCTYIPFRWAKSVRRFNSSGV